MFVSVVIARGIAAELRSRGVNPDRKLAEMGLDEAALSDLRVRITARQLMSWSALQSARAMTLRSG